jgi:hypothetical protein
MHRECLGNLFDRLLVCPRRIDVIDAQEPTTAALLGVAIAGQSRNKAAHM